MQSAVTNQVLILFLLMIVGFIIRKCNVLNNSLNDGISELLINVAVPFSIIVSFNITFSVKILHNIAIAFLVSVFIHLFAVLISRVLYFRYHRDIRKILVFATIFDNSGFMGLPVLGSLFGPMGIFYGSIYVVTFNLFVWTLGVMILNGKKELHIVKAFTNPALVAVLVGFILFFFSIKLPVTIFKTLDMIGSLSTPLSMVVIGSMLAELNFRALLNDFSVYYSTMARLLIVPLGVAFILKFCGIEPHLLKVCIMAGAMPAGTMTAILAKKYNANTLLASRIVFMSTAFSILTIPLVFMLT
ncbi:MAG TPA: AEC family transporter [Firmicutes bacterium]|jgi:malate permease and related proteins|nr:AEC family transporter [Bacillota bacterium]